MMKPQLESKCAPLSVDDGTESEDEAVDTKPRMEPTDEAAAAHRHKDVTKEKIETSQGTATTEMRPQTDTRSTHNPPEIQYRV